MSVADTSRLTQRLALAVLAALLVLLATRMTMTETVRTSLRMLASERAPKSVLSPGSGPATTLGFCVVALALAAAAAWLRPPTRRAWTALAVIAAAIAAMAVSAAAAQNRFAALVGSADVAMALLAGWAALLLAGTPGARKLLVAGLFAILAAWAARAMVQRFVDFPEMLDYYTKHRVEALAQQGIRPDSPEEFAFWHRMKSQEASGFLNLANVFANGLVGLVTIALAIAAAPLLFPRPPESAPAPASARRPPKDRSPSPARRPGEIEIPLRPAALTIGGVLLAATLAASAYALYLTDSVGGAAAATVCAGVLILSLAARSPLSRHRWKLLATFAVLVLCIAGALVAYGVRHDRLPSRSLLFRWHYWTATAPLIEQHPLTGVGLNNFGDYYPSLKRPSAPEEVQDPHSFFIRFAAEAGLPVAALVAALIVLYVLAALRRRAPIDAALTPAMPILTRADALAGLAICTAWWFAHFALTYTRTSSDVAFLDAVMSLLYGLVALAAFLSAMAVQNEAAPRSARIFPPVLLLAASGMLLYDQVNMALVTGPVAMLLWMLLGSAAASDDAAPRRVPSRIAAASLAAAAVLLAALAWIPVLCQALPCDPAPFERRAVDASLRDDPRAALTELNAALTRAPRALDILHWRTEAKRRLHQPIADDIERMLDLDRANARIRLDLALPDSDLAPARRAAILARALELDQALAADEAKRLKPDEIATVRRKIAELTLPK